MYREPFEQYEPYIEPKKTGNKKSRFFFIAVIFGILIGIFFILNSAPADFPVGTTYVVRENLNLRDISTELRNQNYISSISLFESLVVMYGREKSISPGDYYFEKKTGILGVAKSLSGGFHGISEIKVTFPEGYTRDDMGRVLAFNMTNFSKEQFMLLTKNDEGYLFPDTYFFFPSTGVQEIVVKMKKTYEKRVSPLRPEILKSGKSEKNIITMASLIEKESDKDDDRKIVSGILWNRINKGMALQVDATIGYLTGKTSAELTISDLKINSPYNTYIHTGLPPAPICNPGLSSIEAAISPANTDYLYYLHDKNGDIHYAKTFEEHKKNINKYLK